MTTDYVNFTTSSPRYKYSPSFYPHEALGVSIVLHALDIFGFVANSVTIAVIYRSPSLKSIFNYIILSLSASDLISAITDPLYVYRRTTANWILSNFMCKLQRATENGPSVATSLHIVFLSLFRFISIQFPHQFRKVTIKQTKVVILILWLIAICGGSLPFLIWAKVKTLSTNRRICHLSNSYGGFQLYTSVGYLVFYHIPLILVFLFSVGIAASLLHRRKQRTKTQKTSMRVRVQIKNDPKESRQRKERFAIMQTFLIVGSFAFGYLPNTAYYMYLAYGPSHGDPRFSYRRLWWFAMSARICLRLSECMNPIFYNIASSKMRKETILFLRGVINRLPFIGGRCISEKPHAEKSTVRRSNTTAISTITTKI
ncbi:unnamed protein product [Clavelina lepadiformis]|uniref:G-protein coupled receptors family 1 profile domain-containing protein n=1 Tax=Clavelina lepadiformis TaxID=159417 RepID=A0ABP0FI78_CLALP